MDLRMFRETMASIAQRILNDMAFAISHEEASELAVHEGGVVDMLVCADKIRAHYRGNTVFTCSIINAKSGSCSEDCAFCAQSARHKTGVSIYPMLTEQEIVDRALRMEDAGATKYSMVTSGFMLREKEIDIISAAAAQIRDRTALDVCASLGELTETMARKLRDSGISTYHHNLETAESYFHNICTTHAYAEDIRTVRIAASAGFRVCCGGILGMGESWEQRIELAFTLRELDVDSIPLNFLNPIPGTRMENASLMPPMEALKCIALFRIINPDRDITICGGRERVLGDFQSWVFLAGANGLMIGDYLTTAGRNEKMDMEMITNLGLRPET